jgi:hypothetical protein
VLIRAATILEALHTQHEPGFQEISTEIWYYTRSEQMRKMLSFALQN